MTTANEKINSPLLADVIVKVQHREILSAEEEYVYLNYVKTLPKEQVKSLLEKFYLHYRLK